MRHLYIYVIYVAPSGLGWDNIYHPSFEANVFFQKTFASKVALGYIISPLQGLDQILN